MNVPNVKHGSSQCNNVRGETLRRSATVSMLDDDDGDDSTMTDFPFRRRFRGFFSFLRISSFSSSSRRSSPVATVFLRSTKIESGSLDKGLCAKLI